MKKFIVGLCITGVGVIASQAQNYNNSTITSQIFAFGYPNTATYGQVFTAPNSVLDDWTIYLENTDITPQNFEFFLMAWNGSEATGPVLYQSGIQTITASQTSYTPFTVDPNATVTIGDSYVMFINESGLNVGNYGYIAQGGNSTSPLGGAFEYLDNGDTFSEVTTTPWETFSVPDTAYIADFSAAPVPEPATLGILGLGGFATLLLSRRRK